MRVLHASFVVGGLIGCGGAPFLAGAPAAADGGVDALDAGASVDGAPGDAAGATDATDGTDAGRPRGRVTADLVALYEMQEPASDSALRDTSGVLPPVDLAFRPNASYQRVSGGVRFVQQNGQPAGVAVSDGPPKRIVDALNANNEATLEAWVENEATTDYEPFLSIAAADYSRYGAVIEMHEKLYSIYFNPGGWLDASAATRRLAHVVATRSSAGVRSTFVDGQLRDTQTHRGPLAIDATYVLSVGGAADGTRPFRGILRLAAIYARALTAAEVQQNFAAGADP